MRKYRPSESRFSGGGQTKYLVYRSAQRTTGGRSQERTRVKRLYFPASARRISVGRPGTQERRTGSRVHGVAVRYESVVPRTQAQRGGTRYELPARSVVREKIVELPRGAAEIRLTNRPPEGPRQAVR